MLLRRAFLIRHGETEWSLSGQHTGTTDIPLTEHGRSVARQLEPILASATFSLVLTSPLHRARETCELAGLGAQAEVDPNLMEWNYGEYEGLTPKQIHAKRPGWMLFSDGCPGGESPSQVGARVDQVIARVRVGRGRCGAVCARSCLQGVCGAMAGASSHRRMSLPSRHGDDERPQPLPRHPGGEAVERPARAAVERPGNRGALTTRQDTFG